MKKLLLILLLVPMVTFGQNNYSDGYKVGYKKGYCADNVACAPPVIPVAPLSVAGGGNTYNDGYNRGVIDGNKANSSSSSSSGSSSRRQMAKGVSTQDAMTYGAASSSGNQPVDIGNAFMEGYNKSKAAADAARKEKLANMSPSKTETIVPLKIDLYNYTHIALVDVTLACFGSKQFTDWSTYKVMMKRLENSPLKIINPRKFNKKRWRKDKRFLREIKNPKWLYLYLVQSKEGYDYMERLVLRDSENKLIYNIKTTNLSSACDASYEAYGVLLDF